MSNNLYQAHNQWKSRPSDERFETLNQMNTVCGSYMDQALEAEANLSDLRVEACGTEIKLIGAEGTPAAVSHYAMGQLSTKVGAPAAYLRTLPATLAAQNLNHGLKARARDDVDSKLLFHSQEGPTLRAATSEKYTRIWNAEITQKLVEFQGLNPQWKNPLAYKVEGVSSSNGWPSFSRDMVPSGLYASDHDMFAFLVDESKRLDGSPEGLNRGFFMWNSEVGDKSFGGSFFLYDRVCGNNIVWGAENVIDFRIRHIGNADQTAFHKIRIELKKYADSSAIDAERMVTAAKAYDLGGTKQDALDALLKMAQAFKAPELTATRLDDALSLAESREDRYGQPRSLWAAVSGLTEMSQAMPYADQRNKIDRAAGKLLKTIKF